jgi:hypothetical protein
MRTQDSLVRPVGWGAGRRIHAQHASDRTHRDPPSRLRRPSAAVTTQLTAAPIVLEPDTNPFGKTYGEWSADWWQWAFSVPVNKNPLKDTKGKYCGEGQPSGPVFFLAGSGTPGTYNRTCAVPANKALFFPIVNSEDENTVPEVKPKKNQPPQTTKTVEMLRAELTAVEDGAHDLSAELDGVSIPDLALPTRYRAVSPVFSITPPDHNLLQDAGFYAPGGETITPAVADGIYLMLAPLSPGEHTLHFHGSLGDPLDVTYHLNVAG